MNQQRTSLSHQLEISGNNVQYDTEVKKVLSNKIILAWILKYSTEEFKEATLEEIKEAIEGTPEISTIPVYPGKTAEMITGMSNEDKVPNESEVRYDIRFIAFTPNKERIKLIVNIEAQKSYHPGYDLVTRAIYYCARMLSAQADTEFVIPEYDGLKKVYSIWICMNTPKYAQNTITRYKIKQEKVFGNFSGTARYDLLSVIMLCLGTAKLPTENPLLGMLSVLLSPEINVEEKEIRLQTNYGLEHSIEIKEGLQTMCNLSYSILEKGIEQGKAELIRNCLKKLGSCEQVAELLGVSLEEVTIVAKKMKADS